MGCHARVRRISTSTVPWSRSSAGTGSLSSHMMTGSMGPDVPAVKLSAKVDTKRTKAMRTAARRYPIPHRNRDAAVSAPPSSRGRVALAALLLAIGCRGRAHGGGAGEVEMLRGTVAAGAPGSSLRAGMHLVYRNDGQRQEPWTIDSVRVGGLTPEQSDCVTYWIRLRAAQPSEERTMCVRGTMLQRWDASLGALRDERPVVPRQRWSVGRANGDLATYETGDLEEATVGTHKFLALPTTVTTRNMVGVVLRRLRERYVLVLLTASDGG